MLPINHDIHQHTHLSACCHDPLLVPETILEHAIQAGYDTVCITDHFWDPAVPGASPWYAPQNLEHVRKNLPVPKADGVRFLFGCETEYCGKQKLAISLPTFDYFDFVVIPVNHFHMQDFVRPSHIVEPEEIAGLMIERLLELQALPLPFTKIGVAHFTCTTTRLHLPLAPVYDAMPEEQLFDIFDKFAKLGAGIELNACGFPASEADQQALYRPYQIAKAAGCKFYFASDAHRVQSLDIQQKLRPVVQALSLTPDDIYHIPA